MSNAIDDARSLIETRLSELDAEQQRLENALKELGGSVRSKANRGGQRGKASARTARRRKRVGGTRAEHAHTYIAKHPGASASDVARKLKIKPNYLYRVLGDLEKEGKVKKNGRKYNPA